MADTKRVLAGHVYVDAGLIWVGDPCYVMGDDASSRVTDWGDFCGKLFNDPGYNEGFTKPLGDGTGIAVRSGYGDGSYPVYVTYEKDDLFGGWIPSKVEIDFMVGGDDD
jgi:hypothetical protein